MEIDNAPLMGVGNIPLMVLVPGDQNATHAPLAGALMFLIGRAPATTIAESYELLTLYESLQTQFSADSLSLSDAELAGCIRAIEGAADLLGVNAAIIHRRLQVS